MRLPLIALGVALALAPAVAFAQAPAAAPKVFTTANTPLGDILDNPAARAVVDKDANNFTQNDQISQARGLTLAALQQYASNILTDQVLAKIDADFAKLSAK